MEQPPERFDEKKNKKPAKPQEMGPCWILAVAQIQTTLGPHLLLCRHFDTDTLEAEQPLRAESRLRRRVSRHRFEASPLCSLSEKLLDFALLIDLPRH